MWLPVWVLGCVGAGMCVSMCLLGFVFLNFGEHMSFYGATDIPVLDSGDVSSGGRGGFN